MQDVVDVIYKIQLICLVALGRCDAHISKCIVVMVVLAIYSLHLRVVGRSFATLNFIMSRGSCDWG